MSTQTLPSAAKSLIESGRSTLVNAIDAGRAGTQGTLKAYDKLFKAGTDTLARAPLVMTAELRDNLVSIEGQLTMIANLLAQNVADHATDATNRLAVTATGAAESFELVFDLRVREALGRLGVPNGDVVSALADRIAALARDIERLIRAAQTVPATPAATRKAPTAVRARAGKTRRAGKAAA